VDLDDGSLKVAIPAGDRARLDRLCRYLARPPISVRINAPRDRPLQRRFLPDRLARAGIAP